MSQERIRVIDGDTAVKPGDSRGTRLLATNAPETDQVFGAEATMALRDFLGDNGSVEQTGRRDRYGRSLGDYRNEQGQSWMVEGQRQGHLAPTQWDVGRANTLDVFGAPNQHYDPRAAAAIQYATSRSGSDARFRPQQVTGSNFKRSVDRGMDQMAASFNALFGNDERAKDINYSLSHNPRDVESFRDVIANPGKFGSWFVQLLGEELPSLVLDGTLAATGAGTGAVVARRAAVMTMRQATTRGAIIGGWSSMAGQMAGSMSNDMIDEDIDYGQRLAYSLVGGAVAGAINMTAVNRVLRDAGRALGIPKNQLASSLMPSEQIAQTFASRLGQVGVTAGYEGVTEVIQEGIMAATKMIALGEDLPTADEFWDWMAHDGLESFASGFFLGGAISGTAHSTGGGIQALSEWADKREAAQALLDSMPQREDRPKQPESPERLARQFDRLRQGQRQAVVLETADSVPQGVDLSAFAAVELGDGSTVYGAADNTALIERAQQVESQQEADAFKAEVLRYVSAEAPTDPNAQVVVKRNPQTGEVESDEVVAPGDIEQAVANTETQGLIPEVTTVEQALELRQQEMVQPTTMAEVAPTWQRVEQTQQEPLQTQQEPLQTQQELPEQTSLTQALQEVQPDDGSMATGDDAGTVTGQADTQVADTTGNVVPDAPQESGTESGVVEVPARDQSVVGDTGAAVGEQGGESGQVRRDVDPQDAGPSAGDGQTKSRVARIASHFNVTPEALVDAVRDTNRVDNADYSELDNLRRRIDGQLSRRVRRNDEAAIALDTEIESMSNAELMERTLTDDDFADRLNDIAYDESRSMLQVVLDTIGKLLETVFGVPATQHTLYADVMRMTNHVMSVNGTPLQIDGFRRRGKGLGRVDTDSVGRATDIADLAEAEVNQEQDQDQDVDGDGGDFIDESNMMMAIAKVVDASYQVDQLVKTVNRRPLPYRPGGATNILRQLGAAFPQFRFRIAPDDNGKYRLRSDYRTYTQAQVDALNAEVEADRRSDKPKKPWLHESQFRLDEFGHLVEDLQVITSDDIMQTARFSYIRANIEAQWLNAAITAANPNKDAKGKTIYENENDKREHNKLFWLQFTDGTRQWMYAPTVTGLGRRNDGSQAVDQGRKQQNAWFFDGLSTIVTAAEIMEGKQVDLAKTMKYMRSATDVGASAAVAQVIKGDKGGKGKRTRQEAPESDVEQGAEAEAIEAQMTDDLRDMDVTVVERAIQDANDDPQLAYEILDSLVNQGDYAHDEIIGMVEALPESNAARNQILSRLDADTAKEQEFGSEPFSQKMSRDMEEAKSYDPGPAIPAVGQRYRAHMARRMVAVARLLRSKMNSTRKTVMQVAPERFKSAGHYAIYQNALDTFRRAEAEWTTHMTRLKERAKVLGVTSNMMAATVDTGFADRPVSQDPQHPQWRTQRKTTRAETETEAVTEAIDAMDTNERLFNRYEVDHMSITEMADKFNPADYANRNDLVRMMRESSQLGDQQVDGNYLAAAYADALYRYFEAPKAQKRVVAEQINEELNELRAKHRAWKTAWVPVWSLHSESRNSISQMLLAAPADHLFSSEAGRVAVYGNNALAGNVLAAVQSLARYVQGNLLVVNPNDPNLSPEIKELLVRTGATAVNNLARLADNFAKVDARVYPAAGTDFALIIADSSTKVSEIMHEIGHVVSDAVWETAQESMPMRELLPLRSALIREINEKFGKKLLVSKRKNDSLRNELYDEAHHAMSEYIADVIAGRVDPGEAATAWLDHPMTQAILNAGNLTGRFALGTQYDHTTARYLDDAMTPITTRPGVLSRLVNAMRSVWDGLGTFANDTRRIWGTVDGELTAMKSSGGRALARLLWAAPNDTGRAKDYTNQRIYLARAMDRVLDRTRKAFKDVEAMQKAFDDYANGIENEQTKHIKQFFNRLYHQYLKPRMPGLDLIHQVDADGKKRPYTPMMVDRQTLMTPEAQADFIKRLIGKQTAAGETINYDMAQGFVQSVLKAGWVADDSVDLLDVDDRPQSAPAANAAKRRDFMTQEIADTLREGGYMVTDAESLMALYVNQMSKRAAAEETLSGFRPFVSQRSQQRNRLARLAEAPNESTGRPQTFYEALSALSKFPRIRRMAQNIPGDMLADSIPDSVLVQRVQEIGVREGVLQVLPNGDWGIYDETYKAKQALQMIRDVSDPEWRRAVDLMDAVFGRVGQDMPETLRTVQSRVQAYQAYRTLAFSAVASLPDLMGPILRARDLNYMKIAMQESIAALAQMKKTRELGEDHGHANERIDHMLLLESQGLQFMDHKSQRATEILFKYNGQQVFTQMSRAVATRVGRRLITHAYQVGDAQADAFLASLGLKPSDVKAWAEAGYPTMRDTANVDRLPSQGVERTIAAINRFTDESIVRPHAMVRPGWASNPYFALVWQLSSFFYAYGRNIVLPFLQHTAGHIKAGRIARGLAPYMVAVPGLMFLSVMTMVIRDMIQKLATGVVLAPMAAFGGDEWEERWRSIPQSGYFSKLEPHEYAWEAFRRTGVLGPYEKLMGLSGDRPMDQRAASLAGPTFPQLLEIYKFSADALQSPFRDDKNTTFMPQYTKGNNAFAPVLINAIPGISQMSSFKHLVYEAGRS